MSTAARPRLVLVTGATGYVGGRLVPRLLAAGYRVRCLVRDAARLQGRAWLPQVEVATGDVLQEATLAGAHLHADAADRLVAQGCGPIGLCAGELIDQARYNLNAWIVASR